MTTRDGHHSEMGMRFSDPASPDDDGTDLGRLDLVLFSLLDGLADHVVEPIDDALAASHVAAAVQRVPQVSAEPAEIAAGRPSVLAALRDTAEQELELEPAGAAPAPVAPTTAVPAAGWRRQVLRAGGRAAVATVALLAGTTGLAAAEKLPAPASRTIATVVNLVGLPVPGPIAREVAKADERDAAKQRAEERAELAAERAEEPRPRRNAADEDSEPPPTTAPSTTVPDTVPSTTVPPTTATTEPETAPDTTEPESEEPELALAPAPTEPVEPECPGGDRSTTTSSSSSTTTTETQDGDGGDGDCPPVDSGFTDEPVLPPAEPAPGSSLGNNGRDDAPAAAGERAESLPSPSGAGP